MEPLRILKQKRSQSATNGASKKAINNWAYFYQLSTPQTRMAVMHKIDHSPCNMHWAYKTYYIFLMHEITLPAIRIQPTKAVTTLAKQMPMRLIISTLRIHQIYRVSQNHKKAIGNPTKWSLSRDILQLKNLFFKSQSFGFLLPFPAKIERFFIDWSVISSTVYPRPVLQEPSVNAALFWKVGFPS